MQQRTGQILAITGGLLAVIASACIFAVTIGGLKPGGSCFIYGTPSVFGISDPEVIMAGFCTLIIIFGAMGIAGGLYAGKREYSAATLMLVPGIAGFLVLSIMWAPIGALLIAGGILTLRAGK